MSFDPSPMEEEIRSLARKFARTELAPIIEEDEREERFRPELIAKMGDLGLTGIPMPEALGGAGLGYVEYIAAVEEIAAVSAGYAISFTVTGIQQLILTRFASKELQEKYVPPLTQGKGIGSFSLSEASSGSDAGSLRTTAKKDGDHYRIQGTKLWTTQADSAATILLLARTGEAGPKGVSAFILEKGDPGVKMGKREKKMGLHVSHTMELVLDDVRIPASRRVGDEGIGFKIAMAALDGARITLAAVALGIARSALEVAIAHSKLRTQFGKPIGEFQGVSFMLADMATSLEQARLLTRKAAWLRDQGKPFASVAAMAKLAATDMAMKATTDAVQVLGGSGYTQEFPVERYMREAKVLQIVEGTNQIQRLVIGRALLEGTHTP